MGKSRIPEQVIAAAALGMLAEEETGFLRTAELIERLEIFCQPSGKDSEISKNRQDTRFSQKVRNLISHRGQPGSLVSKELATYEKQPGGLRITEEGRRVLDRL